MNLHVEMDVDNGDSTTAFESLLLSPLQEFFRRARSTPPKASPRAKRRRSLHISTEYHAENKEEEPSPQPWKVEIEPRKDGTVIELIASVNRPTNLITSSSRANSSIRFNSTMMRGSLLMIDPVTASNNVMSPMNLKILRGKNLPFDNTRIRIGILNREGGAVDQIIGITPSSEGTRDPIWGSQICSWTLKATYSTKILFTLIPENAGERKKKKVPTTLCAKVKAADLLEKNNPNFWTVLKDQENLNRKSNFGRLQIRLTRPTEAKLHEQENCERITAGPAMPRMQSYNVRKLALYSCSPVMLNVYDVSKNSRIQTINNTTKSIGYGGIFHAAIEIQGKEYSFGGTFNKKSKISGVFQCSPKQCPMHHYRESVFLGDCELSSQQVQRIIAAIRPKWLARSYNLFRKNCAFFSREFAIELGVGDIPEWVFSLATTAESIEPYLNKLNTYLKNRTKTTNAKLPRKRINKLMLSKKEKEARIDTREDIEAHKVANNTQEALLDHAMAARIQRNYRAASLRGSLREASLRRLKELQQLQVPMVASA